MRAKLAWVLLTAIVLAAKTPASAEDPVPTAISDIRQESNDRSTRLTIDCTGPIAYTYYSPDPLTLVVDIPEVDASKVPARINVGTREVESLRLTTLGRADGRNLTRIEVRLASLVPYQIYSKDKLLNLVFERPAASAQAAPPQPAPEAASAAEPADAPAQVAADTPAKETAAPDDSAPQAAEDAPADPPAAMADDHTAHGPATRILAVTQAEEAGELTITVRADGSLHYQDFFLGNPERLVVDFKDVVSRSPVKSLDVARGPVNKVRLAQFSASSPKVARLVMDLSTRAPYKIVEGSDGVKIVFGEGHTPSPAPLAALRAEPAPAPVLVAGAALAPPALPPPPPIAAPAALPDAPPQGQPTGNYEARTVGPAPKLYTGHPISLDFKDGDLQDIFRLFADISGLNVVVNPGISGKVTLKLTEVPWDQALDLILKTNGLGRTIDDNVIRIARLSDLQKEEEDLRKLKENQALAGDLDVWRKSLSYAKAADLEATVRKVALSARGTITIDTRTNTMIVTDLPINIEKARDLIADLDRATKQVEIEARIVVTTRNFTRDLGIQWGFLNRQTPQFGNTTNKTFPNSIVLNGQGVPSTGGLQADQGPPPGLSSGAGIGVGPRGYAVNLPAANFNSAIGISLGNIIGSFNLDAALTALERQGRGRILSTPKVTTQNNQAAEIKQGVQIPIQTIANNTVTVQFKDAVLTLKVTPQITEADTIILNLEVENNTADFANLVNGIPPINTQSAKTIVLVRDGATTVIGGIYQSNEQTAQSSTPFLGRIPLLGYLFRNRFVTNTNNELLLFVTPRITKG